MRLWRSFWWVFGALVATLANLAAQNPASTRKVPIIIAWFNGFAVPFTNPSSPQMQSVQAALQANPAFQGYIITIQQYTYTGLAVDPDSGQTTGRTILQDLAANPDLLT